MLYIIRSGNIGEEQEEVEFEPLTAPSIPEPVREPVRQPAEPVPA